MLLIFIGMFISLILSVSFLARAGKNSVDKEEIMVLLCAVVVTMMAMIGLSIIFGANLVRGRPIEQHSLEENYTYEVISKTSIGNETWAILKTPDGEVKLYKLEKNPESQFVTIIKQDGKKIVQPINPPLPASSQQH